MACASLPCVIPKPGAAQPVRRLETGPTIETHSRHHQLTPSWRIGGHSAILPSALIQLAQPPGTSAQLARVTYTSGYVPPGSTPTANQIALPADLELACLEQSAYWYQRRSQLGLL